MKLKTYFRWQDNKSPFLAFKDPVVSCVYGMIAWCGSRAFSRDTADESVDILVLYRSKSGRKYPWLIKELSDVSVHEVFIPKKQEIIKNRMLSPVPISSGLEFYLYASYAYYLVKKYRPKVILIDVNGSKVTPFLRLAINSIGGKLVHVAHCIPTDNFRKLSLTDYDYALVYGQSSIDSINAMPVRYGNTKCVITGSIILGTDRDYALLYGQNSIDPQIEHSHNERFCVVLGSTPSLEGKGRVTPVYESMIRWAKDNPGTRLYFKPHPRSDKSLWQRLVNELEAEKSVGIFTSMSECEGADFAVAAFTNAVLDVANLGVPVVWVADESEVDYFKLESYFVPRVSSYVDLPDRVNTIISNLDYYRANAKSFGKYHLGGVDNPTKYVARTLESIVKSEENFPAVDV